MGFSITGLEGMDICGVWLVLRSPLWFSTLAGMVGWWGGAGLAGGGGGCMGAIGSLKGGLEEYEVVV